ncbi:LRR receptor-like serine/threonine-protein kinase fls2, partial [Tulasnella sp. 417]
RNIFSEVGDQLGFAQSVEGLGEVYRMRDEYDQAEESLIQARDVYSQVGNQLCFAQSIRSLGDVYRSRGDYPNAKRSYIQAMDIFSQIGDQVGYANSILPLGRAYSAQDDYAKAEESYLEAQQIYNRIGDMRGLADTLRFLGSLHSNLARYEDADPLIREASTIYGKLGAEQDVADCDEFLDKNRRLMENWHDNSSMRFMNVYNGQCRVCAEQPEELNKRSGHASSTTPLTPPLAPKKRLSTIIYICQDCFAMDDYMIENRVASQPTSPTTATFDELGEGLDRIRISPQKVLGSLGHLRIDRARVKPIEALDQGGTAVVEAAILAPVNSSNSQNPKDIEYVAIKKLRLDAGNEDGRALGPFAHEVNLLNELSHENVVKIIGFVEDAQDGVAWMVFNWEKNGNLREFVRSADWELPARVSLIDDVVKGLNYLHGRNPPICHGDMKSLNILVNSRLRAIITDFGSARPAGPVTEPTTANTTPMTDPQSNAPADAPLESLKPEVSSSGEFITIT